MILGLVSSIVAAAGIVGFFTGFYWLTFLGCIIAIVVYVVGLVSGSLKSGGLTTLFIAIIIAVILSINGLPFLLSVALCICFENVVLFLAGLILLFFTVFRR